MSELRLVSSTEKPTECLFCGNETPVETEHFCSQWCYEQWFELKKANMLAIVLDLVID